MRILDPIGDMIARIKNALMRRRDSVVVPYSRMRAAVLGVLKAEGYIQDFSETTTDKHRSLTVALKYYEGHSVITQMKRVSKPSLRIYAAVKDLPRVRNGLGISVLSTPRGVLSDAMARQQNVGGEVLFTVF